MPLLVDGPNAGPNDQDADGIPPTRVGSDGGFELPLLLLTIGFFVSVLGPGSYSIDTWTGIGNWTGIHWGVSDEIRAGAAVGVGAAAGLLTLAAGWALKAIDAGGHEPSAAH